MTATHVDWQLNRGIPEIPSPVCYGNRICLVRNGGYLADVDAADGAMLYEERLGGRG